MPHWWIHDAQLPAPTQERSAGDKRMGGLKCFLRDRYLPLREDAIIKLGTLATVTKIANVTKLDELPYARESAANVSACYIKSVPQPMIPSIQSDL